jgi:purine nucleosidase
MATHSAGSQFTASSPDKLAALLAPPASVPISMVLDTDTYNEIDDQFALVYALLSERLSVEAVYAAPFHNDRSTSAGDGMEKSYEEIERVLGRLGRSGSLPVLRGSRSFMGPIAEPVPSAVATDLVERANRQRGGPLYVVAIGAITNVASALLLDPSIVDRIVVVWLGGHPWYWKGPNDEFNLRQDGTAARVVFDSGVPLVHVPCANVAEHLRSTLPEMREFVKGRGAIGDYLYEIFEAYFPEHYARSKVIWDISTIAWLNDPSFVPSELLPSPVLRADLTWGPVDPSRHLIRQATTVKRDLVFGDLFHRLEALASKQS